MKPKNKVAGFNLPEMPRSKRQDYPVIEAQVAPKHTPGPWTIDKHIDRLAIKNIREMPTRNGTIEETVFEVKDGIIPSIEDARLIAAAPEMLEALKWIEREVTKLDPEMKDGFSWRQLNAVRAAIAKAEGRDK